MVFNALIYLININKRTNVPSAAPSLSSFPMGKKLNTTQRGATQGTFVLLFLFTLYDLIEVVDRSLGQFFRSVDSWIERQNHSLNILTSKSFSFGFSFPFSQSLLRTAYKIFYLFWNTCKIILIPTSRNPRTRAGRS